MYFNILTYATLKRIQNYVGACALRFADRNEDGTKNCRRFSQKNYGRRLYDVSIFDVHSPLRQQRKRRRSHQTSETNPARKRFYRHYDHHRQAIRQY